MFADYSAKRLGLFLVSGFRSVEHQRRLFQAAVRKYGSESAARKWVAPPGRSNHGPRRDGYGTAIDIGVPGVKALKGRWPAHVREEVDRIAARHGLFSPMEWEDWHFEPIKNWEGDELSAADVEALKGHIDKRVSELRELDAKRAREWAIKTLAAGEGISVAEATKRLDAVK
jgi:LAS superfamily LD-carboxypeptidase LdcB